MKKYITTVIGVSLILFLTGCVTVEYKDSADSFAASCDDNPQKISDHTYSSNPCILPDDRIKNKKAVIETEVGTIEFELLPDTAPYSVSNFVFLAEDGYYEGISFHRRDDSINIIQAGDPNSLNDDPSDDGQGGPGYTFGEEPPESAAAYKKGVVAMAKTNIPVSSGSQFFIMIDDFEGFNPEYSIFGQVLSGQDVVEIIQPGDKINSVNIESIE